MKVKIIKSIPHTIFGHSIGGIESLVGNEYNVIKQCETFYDDGAMMIYVPEWRGLCSVFSGEYEIVN